MEKIKQLEKTENQRTINIFSILEEKSTFSLVFPCLFCFSPNFRRKRRNTGEVWEQKKGNQKRETKGDACCLFRLMVAILCFMVPLLWPVDAFFWCGCLLLLLLMLVLSHFLLFMLHIFAFCIPLPLLFVPHCVCTFLHFLKNVLHLFCICSGFVLLLCLSLFSYLFPNSSYFWIPKPELLIFS